MTVATPKPQCTKRSSTSPWTREDEGIQQCNKILAGWNYPYGGISLSSTDRDYLSICICLLKRLGVVSRDDVEGTISKIFKNLLYILSYPFPHRDLTGQNLKAAVCWMCICLGAAESISSNDWSPGCRLILDSVYQQTNNRKLSIQHSTSGGDCKLSEKDVEILAKARSVVEHYSDLDLSKTSDLLDKEIEQWDLNQSLFLAYRIRLLTKDNTLRDRQEKIIFRFLHFQLLLLTKQLERDFDGFYEDRRKREELLKLLEDEYDRIKILKIDLNQLKENIKSHQEMICEKNKELSTLKDELASLIKYQDQQHKKWLELHQADENNIQTKITFDDMRKQCEDLELELREEFPVKKNRKLVEKETLEAQAKKLILEQHEFWAEFVKEYRDQIWPSNPPVGSSSSVRGINTLPLLRGDITFNLVYIKKYSKEFESAVGYLKNEQKKFDAKIRQDRSARKELKAKLITETQAHQQLMLAKNAELRELNENLELANQALLRETELYEQLKMNDFDDRKLKAAEDNLSLVKNKTQQLHATHEKDFQNLLKNINGKLAATEDAQKYWVGEKKQIDKALNSLWQTIRQTITAYKPTENPSPDPAPPAGAAGGSEDMTDNNQAEYSSSREELSPPESSSGGIGHNTGVHHPLGFLQENVPPPPAAQLGGLRYVVEDKPNRTGELHRLYDRLLKTKTTDQRNTNH